jgi:hypothetical protein
MPVSLPRTHAALRRGRLVEDLKLSLQATSTRSSTRSRAGPACWISIRQPIPDESRGTPSRDICVTPTARAWRARSSRAAARPPGGVEQRRERGGQVVYAGEQFGAVVGEAEDVLTEPSDRRLAFGLRSQARPGTARHRRAAGGGPHELERRRALRRDRLVASTIRRSNSATLRVSVGAGVLLGIVFLLVHRDPYRRADARPMRSASRLCRDRSRRTRRRG